MSATDNQKPQSTSWNLLARVLAATIVILLLGIGAESYFLYQALFDHPLVVDPLPKVTLPLHKSPSLSFS